MSRRLNSPDTEADGEIQACIRAIPPQSFVVRAGAGSGKTTSLIKALDCVISTHGTTMRRKKQQVACITYTELAANEINSDINDSHLVHVSTIHSFYWTIAKTFQSDIKIWLVSYIQYQIDGLIEARNKFNKRISSNTRENNAIDQKRYASHLEAIKKLKTFSYGVGSDYPKGVLGHEDILKLTDFLLQEKPLFRKLVALKFPFIFIDESQDTFESVVKSFKLVEQQMRGQFCLGFFGDPMQKIFQRGAGDITLEDNWASITKPENFRCAKKILDLANSIRAKGDGLQQVRGLHEEIDNVQHPVKGSARMFILPNTINRQQALADIRSWSDAADNDKGWRTPDIAVKILVIVHRIAAKRLGFGSIYSALNDLAPDSIKHGMQDGTGWPVRPFLSFILPLVSAMKAGNEFEAINLLRSNCPRLQQPGSPQSGTATILRELREDVIALVQMFESTDTSIREISIFLREKKLMTFEERFDKILNHLDDPSDTTDDAHTERFGQSDMPIMAFLSCPAHELWPYQRYISEGSPFATQHGVKGAQFDRVIVVMDEEESNYRQYDYEKFFGIKEVSARDRQKLENGEDTSWSKTLRLLYVACTRAKRRLALVFFVQDPEAAVTHVVASGVLPKDAILTHTVLAQV